MILNKSRSVINEFIGFHRSMNVGLLSRVWVVQKWSQHWKVHPSMDNSQKLHPWDFLQTCSSPAVVGASPFPSSRHAASVTLRRGLVNCINFRIFLSLCKLVCFMRLMRMFQFRANSNTIPPLVLTGWSGSSNGEVHVLIDKVAS